MTFNFKSIRVTFGTNVRKLRRQRGWSQEQLGEYAETDRTFISQIERFVANPSLEVISKIASALQVSPGSLVDKLYR